MKFSATTLLVILPLLAAQVSALAVPEAGFARRAGNAKGGQGGQGSFGGKGGKGAAAGAGAAAAKGKGGASANSTRSAAGSAATAAASNATAANATAAAGGGDPQTSLTLDPAVICPGFAQDGNEVPVAGQVASATSVNNFINFCKDKGALTNGQQLTQGSCNPAPMGQIPPTTAMPSCKFQFPQNMQDIAANTPFTIKMAISGMETGIFVNAEKSYFAAPQQLNAQNQIIGHSHVVVQLLTSLTQDTPLDPTKFAFFQGLNSAAVGGVLTANVSSGLPAGAYKLSSINTAGNHQPVLGPVAQHGSFDDSVYFTVGGAGAGASNATAGAGAASTSAATGGKGGASAASSAAAAATGAVKGGAGGKGAGGSQGGANGGKGKQGRRFIREAY